MLISQLTADRTLDWLKNNPGDRFSPSLFFGRVWTRHRIVTIGERHVDDAHRVFVARMVNHWGGPQNGVALEIAATHQTAVDAFLTRDAALPSGYFSRQARFQSILAAARNSQTAVVCMDHPNAESKTTTGSNGPLVSSVRVDRDRHMADAVMHLAERKSKVLVFVGMQHAAESVAKGTPSLGARLVKSFGRRVYTICAMTKQGHSGEPFFETLKAEFGGEGAIAFDLDRSPLARELFIDPALKASISWGDYADGVMVFFNN